MLKFTFFCLKVTSKGPNTVFKYFNWLYWCINIGSLSSLSGLAYMQQSESFFEGYTIPWGCLVLAFILFLTGINPLTLTHTCLLIRKFLFLI